MVSFQQPINHDNEVICIAPVSVIDQAEAYIVLQFGGMQEQRWVLDRECPLTIGRHADCDIRLPDRRVSSRHAQIRWQDGHYSLMDLDSKNGTYVNGRRINRPTLLHNGNALQIAVCFTLLFVETSCM